MVNRPYFNSGIDELERIFAMLEEVESLETLRTELVQRSTPRSRTLLRRVDEAIERCKSESVKEKMDIRAPLLRPKIEPDSSPPSALSTSSPKFAPEEPETLTENHRRLIDLLTYLEHLAKIGEKPVFNLRDYQPTLVSEAELKGQVGITHDASTEEGPVWLKIERLQRTEPPLPPSELRDWIAVSRDPNQLPKIHPVLTKTVSKIEAEKLVSEGRARREDVSNSPKSVGAQIVDVILRLELQPTLKTAAENFISTRWATWASTEKPRRKTIAIYDKFFSLYQSLQAEGVERPIEVVWGVGVVRWKYKSHEIDHPLIEQLVEIEVDSETGTITVVPRSAGPQIALSPYFALEMEGADLIHSFAKKFFESLPVDVDFSPFQRTTFESLLRFAATRLDPSGRYYPDVVKDINDRSVPVASENLAVTDTWAIYARPRSSNFFIEDLERLEKALSVAGDLPGPSKKLVEPPSAESTYSPTLVNLAKATLGSAGQGSGPPLEEPVVASEESEYFFPKPFNAEQVAIIERLEQADGVVVQGPPGTGKTHTIANIICHYLATGRKVLVTSKGEAALGVLREHIPDGIRDLTISLLTSEKEGLKQLERAVSLLANTASQKNPQQLEREIVDGQQKIIDLKRRLASVDVQLANFAQKHLRRIAHRTNTDGLLPIELARVLVEDSDRHSWFVDELKLDPSYDPLFQEEDIDAIRVARCSLGQDLDYVKFAVPALSDLPDSDQVIAIHNDLLNWLRVSNRIREMGMPRLEDFSDTAAEKCGRVLVALKELVRLFDVLDELPWLKAFPFCWGRGKAETDHEKLFEGLLAAVNETVRRRKEILPYAVVCPESAIDDEELNTAIRRAALGERPFGLLGLGKASTKDRFALIRIEGRTPRDSNDWARVEQFLVSRAKLTAAIAKWNAQAADLGLPKLRDSGEATARWFADLTNRITIAKGVKAQEELANRELLQLFPAWNSTELNIKSRDHALKAVEILESNLSLARYQRSRDWLNEFADRLKNYSGKISEECKGFIHKSLGNPALTQDSILEAWQKICAEIGRIRSFDHHIATVKRVAGLVQQSGAPKWAKSLLTEKVNHADKWAPPHCLETWSWARYRSYLEEIDGRTHFKELCERRVEYDAQIRKTFAEVVKLRTYLGLKRNITNQVEAALNMFMAALRHIGKGTGIRAKRFRRNARSAMEKSYAAVPCWIMPTWRVSESLPATLGAFDLVIVDEASQSDVTALPTLLRGKKVLVVGDDKQVSPTAAFVEERKLLQLSHNYLQDQPFGPLMLPGFSLYELALATYPGKRIMLREHFRCVEPIIRFSFQFYEEPILPVRLAKSSERLSPPLIDVHVPNGRKDKRQINIAEAEAIVAEIEKVVLDGAFSKRTIGVVSLLGSKQAYYIQARLLEKIGEERYLRHQITCGDSATFQGKERDIMFVSMVECPETRSTKTALLFQQRFNVALSRARDRMYLFHSVTEEMLKPDDLKAKVLQHFRNPMPEARQAAANLSEQCESEFEREVLKRLLGLGYEVTPQVRVGPFSIDLVVEGENDRRLAIELDGDKYHTPDRWADDLQRQRVLERVGWRFWRCWGSSFLLAPEHCMEDLIAALNEMNIKPGKDERHESNYTEFRVAEVTSDESVDLNEPLDEDMQVEIGDKVLLAFGDEPGRQRTIVIANRQTDEPMGIYSADHVLAKRLLGTMVEDEVLLPMGGQDRQATVVRIARPN